MNTKKTVKLMLDFMQGPIWITDVETGEPLTGIEAIDIDTEIIELNKQIQNLYNSYYEFDSHGQACWFNEEMEKSNKNTMIGLVNKLLSRLSAINDGTFSVEDTITPYLEEV